MIYGASSCDTLEEIVEKVQLGELSARSARDAARCIQLEKISGLSAITVDKLTSVKSMDVREEQHIIADVNTIAINASTKLTLRNNRYKSQHQLLQFQGKVKDI